MITCKNIHFSYSFAFFLSFFHSHFLSLIHSYQTSSPSHYLGPLSLSCSLFHSLVIIINPSNSTTAHRLTNRNPPPTILFTGSINLKTSFTDPIRTKKRQRGRKQRLRLAKIVSYSTVIGLPVGIQLMARSLWNARPLAAIRSFRLRKKGALMYSIVCALPVLNQRFVIADVSVREAVTHRTKWKESFGCYLDNALL